MSVHELSFVIVRLDRTIQNLVKNPAPRAQGVKVKLNIVILRLDRRIHFLFLDCPIKSGNDSLYKASFMDRRLMDHLHLSFFFR